MRITLEVSEDNESTSYPWWVIVDPRQNLDCDYHAIASMVTGPFFSREEAEAELKATRYNYSKRAVVYCKSGCYSRQYQKQIRRAEMPLLRWVKYHMFKEVRHAIVSAFVAVMSYVPRLRTGTRRL